MPRTRRLWTSQSHIEFLGTAVEASYVDDVTVREVGVVGTPVVTVKLGKHLGLLDYTKNTISAVTAVVDSLTGISAIDAGTLTDYFDQPHIDASPYTFGGGDPFPEESGGLTHLRVVFQTERRQNVSSRKTALRSWVS